MGETGKAFRHLQGASLMLQLFSNPHLYLTPGGRALLEWYWNLEDCCTIYLSRKPFLPVRWRYEVIKMRRKLFLIEYTSLSPENKISRFFDELWQEMWFMVPYLAEALTTLIALKHQRGTQLTETL